MLIEITYTWPSEIFIQRHLKALRDARLPIQLVARSNPVNFVTSASLHIPIADLPVKIMPNFDHLSLWGKIHSLRYLKSTKSISMGGKPFRDIVLLEYFRQLNPSLIHFHFGQLAVSMRWICEELQIPFTVSLRGTDFQVIPLQSEKKRQELYQTLVQAAGIHTVCNKFNLDINQQLAECPPTETIYTTVPIPPALPPYPPSQGVFRFLAVGRYHWRKDFPNLLRALRLLRDQGLDAYLTIVGSGSDDGQLPYLIKYLGLTNYVRLWGKGDFGSILKLLTESHAFIQSSIAEGLSNALVEAMAWGCPVFATDVGGTSEVIKHGETGFLLAPGQPEIWPEIMVLAQDQPLMEKVRKAAHLRALEHFLAQNHATKFKKFYAQAI